MRTIFIICAFLSLASMCVSCQDEQDTAGHDGVGYIYMRVGADPSTVISRAADNGKTLAVEIFDSNKTIVWSTKDWNAETDETKEAIELPVGTYTIKAFSATSEIDKVLSSNAYYEGIAENVTVTDGQSTEVSIICKLANVKVTVVADEAFRKAFPTANVTVGGLGGSTSIETFTIGTTTDTVYYPVKDLYAMLSVKNTKGDMHNKFDTISDVKACSHYILSYKIATSGSISIEADPTTKTYKYTLAVSLDEVEGGGEQPSPSDKPVLNCDVANAWSNLVYLEGTASSVPEGETVKFQYKQLAASDWIDVQTTMQGTACKATVTGLTPMTEYEYRLVCGDEATESVSFTTEAQNKIPNMTFDDWYKSGRSYYACAESDFETKFWDSGNEGANSLGEVNPTQPETSDVISGTAVKLKSATAAGQFAAGSLFTGDFGSASLFPLGATLDFGQPYEGRPSQLTGYFKYTPGTVTHTKTNPAGVAKGDQDSCCVYIALAEWNEPFHVNTGNKQFVDLSDESIIAYGELDKGKQSPATAMSAYEKFTIDIKYRSLTRKPNYILIVCTSSKYGDYFTGSTSSILLIDEFDFVFGEPVVDEKYLSE